MLGGSSRVMEPPATALSIREGLQAVEGVQLTVSADESTSGAAAAMGAAGVDVVIVCGATTSGEFYDRPTLQVDQHDFVVAVAAANAAASGPKPLVTLTVASGAILTDWRENASALVHAFQSGQQTGGALADVLFGVTNPAGRTPLTFVAAPNDATPPCVAIDY